MSGESSLNPLLPQDRITETSKIQPSIYSMGYRKIGFNKLGEYLDCGILVPRLTKCAVLTTEYI